MKLFLYNFIHTPAISSPSGLTTVPDTMCFDMSKQMLNGLRIIVFPTVTLMMNDNKAFGFCTRGHARVDYTNNVTPHCSTLRVQMR